MHYEVFEYPMGVKFNLKDIPFVRVLDQEHFMVGGLP